MSVLPKRKRRPGGTPSLFDALTRSTRPEDSGLGMTGRNVCPTKTKTASGGTPFWGLWLADPFDSRCSLRVSLSGAKEKALTELVRAYS